MIANTMSSGVIRKVEGAREPGARRWEGKPHAEGVGSKPDKHADCNAYRPSGEAEDCRFD